jgi:hypothetical protein
MFQRSGSDNIMAPSKMQHNGDRPVRLIVFVADKSADVILL